MAEASVVISEMDLVKKVVEYVDENGNWRWNVLQDKLSASSLLKLAAIKPPSLGDGDDLPFWGWTSFGVFTVKSAYAQLADSQWEEENSAWRKIWLWNGPQHLRVFLWLVGRNKLFTN